MLVSLALTLLAVVGPFDQAARKELAALAGDWDYVKAQAKGQAIDIENEKPHFVTVSGTLWEVRAKGAERVRESARIVALDPSTDPKLIDIRSIPGNPQREGTLLEGIYKLDGDTLVIAFYYGRDKKRPADFDEPKDTETIVWTLKRIKK
jgi:uncharacterized protein (TIGR03067 family)